MNAISYLRFRRNLRRYYENETPAIKLRILGPRSSRFWQRQYRTGIAIITRKESGLIGDAASMAFLMG